MALIERTLRPTRLELLEARLNKVETDGLRDGDRTMRVAVAGFIAGTSQDGMPANLVELEEISGPPGGEIVLITDLPDKECDKGGFFSKLLQQGFDPITYGHIYVSADDGQVSRIEAVTCRKVAPAAEFIAAAASTDSPAETPTPAPASMPAPAPSLPSVPFPQAPEPSAEPPRTDRATPADHESLISERALELILESEGLDQPSCWPGGASGISLGIGYDLGYVKEREFRSDWSAHLPAEHLTRLTVAVGKTGSSARTMARQFRDIRVTRSEGIAVFKLRTLPKFRALALRTFPGMQILPPDAQGALISLVFNRGSSLEGSRRREMKNIQRLIANHPPGASTKELQEQIAAEIVAMKRLWVNKGLDGLLVRRDAEARLARSAIA